MQEIKPYPPESYLSLWLILAIILFLIVCGWLAFVFFYTRKRPEKTLATLEAVPVQKPDINALKQKYLQLIQQLAQQVQEKRITNRKAHQQLSLLVRYFIFECEGIKVQVFTLSDIKQSNFPKLAATIEMYYPPEFAKLENGDTSAAIKTAQELIQSW